jgi:hypothetical protein
VHAKAPHIDGTDSRTESSLSQPERATMKRASLTTAVTAALAGATLLAGASVYAREDAPKAEVALAQQAVDQAQNAGATESAPLELKTARDKLAQAQALLSKDKSRDYPAARSLAEEATADAEVAQARANAARAQKSLDEVNASVRAMQQETMRPRS